MKSKFRILLAKILVLAVIGGVIVFQGCGAEPSASQSKTAAAPEATIEQENQNTGNYFTEDTLYRWNEQIYDLVPVVQTTEEYQQQLGTEIPAAYSGAEPIEITWEELMDIRFRLRYYSEVDMEMLAPVFPKALKALEGKRVTITGFVIPFDEEQELLALSANPFAACFFCGRASPASVISMYLKDSGKRYKMDDFKKLSGTLHLNLENPNEFYYILRDAEEG